MNNFQKLVLRALGAILYCVTFQDNMALKMQGHDARKQLIKDLRDAVHSQRAGEG